MVVVAESGARLCNLLLACLLALRSAILAARSRGTARSKSPRRAGAEEEVAEVEDALSVAEAASVDRAAAVTRVGVIVQVGSGHLWDGGIEQEAVVVFVVRTGMAVTAVFLSVAVFVTTTVEIAGVMVTVGDF
jgi:hypothetical protein